MYPGRDVGNHNSETKAHLIVQQSTQAHFVQSGGSTRIQHSPFNLAMVAIRWSGSCAAIKQTETHGPLRGGQTNAIYTALQFTHNTTETHGNTHTGRDTDTQARVTQERPNQCYLHFSKVRHNNTPQRHTGTHRRHRHMSHSGLLSQERPN